MSGPLDNQRHELFAQAVARGESTTDAYVAAGYKPSDQNAYRLAKNERVAARVKALLARAARRTEISIASATESLLRLADKAEDIGSAPGIQAARASIMDAAKLNGLVIETTERIIRTPEERRARVEDLKKQLEGTPKREAQPRVH